MDLVGIDVNLEVARSFWERSFHELRWRPSPLQARLVDAGRLDGSPAAAGTATARGRTARTTLRRSRPPRTWTT
jgi:3-hydroxyacyl-CoA dehydrogenase